jgi:uncharacterized protein YneR
MRLNYFLAATALIVFVTANLFAQSFEGTIEFTRKTTIDTTKYKYHIKDNMVRIEEIGSNGQIAGIMIVNTKERKAKSLSPDRKLYMEMESANSSFIKIDGSEVKKGKSSKTIAGYKCDEWTVSNKEQNTTITYYLAKDNFIFFDDLIIALNRKDKFATYYQQLPETSSSFPFLAIEKDLSSGKEKAKLEVDKVTKKAIDAKLFEIPSDYKKFEK